MQTPALNHTASFGSKLEPNDGDPKGSEIEMPFGDSESSGQSEKSLPSPVFF